MSTQTTKLTEEQIDTIAKLTKKMLMLGAPAKPVPEVTTGPVVSVYRFVPTGTTKVSQIEALARDFAVELSCYDVVVKRIPGENYVGVFVPNKERKFIEFVDTTTSLWKVKDSLLIPLNLGVTQTGAPLIDDLTQLPHLLIAGATGSGKSTLLCTLITSVMVSKTPEQVMFVLSDTKGVEFRQFEGMKHLLFPISYSPEDTISHLRHIINEMEDRLLIIGASGSKNIEDYNASHVNKFPYYVVVVDELADIMEVRGEKRSERPGQDAVNKLAQKARATGIHLIAGTQRPSVNIVSGSIKANFPARLSFRLVSDADSRTVLGTTGAEHLLAKGDMFYLSPNSPGLTRAHAPRTRAEDVKAALEMVMST